MAMRYIATVCLQKELHEKWKRYTKNNNTTNEELMKRAIVIMKSLPENFAEKNKDVRMTVQTKNEKLYKSFIKECKRTKYSQSKALRIAAEETFEMW